MKKQERRIIYYTDEQNDEFSTAQITPKRIDGNYVYLPGGWWKKFTRFFWYRIVATPLAFLYLKLWHGHRVKNRRILKPYRSTGYFLFGNHTQDVGDALIPTMLTFPKSAFAIVHPNNVSMPILGRITPSLGALPLPDTMDATRRFLEAVAYRIRQGNAMVVYPEAHIWPYYTDIRPFSDASFRYPIRYGVPAFAFTNTYQKRGIFRRPRIVTYLDGPFYPTAGLRGREANKDLRDQVYAAMKERAKCSQISYIVYRKQEKQENEGDKT